MLISLNKTFEKAILNHWENIAFEDYNGASLHYKDIARLIFGFHKYFKAIGVEPGDKISIIGNNSANWAVIYLSTVTYGAVAVPILSDFSASDIKNIISHSDSKVLFLSKKFTDKVNLKGFDKLQTVVSLDNFSVIQSQSTAELQLPTADDGGLDINDFSLATIEDETLISIHYTSGTTGFSKGVMIPARSIKGNIAYARDNFGLLPSHNVVSFLPLAHVYGCSFEFLWPFTTGARITFVTDPVVATIMEALQKVKPYIILTVPLLLERIYRNNIKPEFENKSLATLIKIPLLKLFIYHKIKRKILDSFGGEVNQLVVGGAAINPTTEQFMRKINLPFAIGYGMTECGPLVSYASWKEAKIGSAGKILPNLEIKIDSENPYKIPGEILIRGSHLMLGYYKNKEVTDKTIDSDGWLHTGDVGCIDKHNYIFIHGRSKTMILGANGQNIYPEEVEAKLNNMPYVKESLVIEEKGKLIGLVNINEEAILKGKLTKDDIALFMEVNRKTINREIASYEQLTEIRIHDEEFEKTPKKTIKRYLYQK